MAKNEGRGGAMAQYACRACWRVSWYQNTHQAVEFLDCPTCKLTTLHFSKSAYNRLQGAFGYRKEKDHPEQLPIVGLRPIDDPPSHR